MQSSTQYCQPDLYSSCLHTIRGIHFTRRQVDILACLSTGRDAKTISNFLQIDAVRTVHSHELYIRGKLECSSRNDIINFLEQCEEFPALKKYYQILKTHFLFAQISKKIFALIPNNYPNISINYCNIKKNNMDFFTIRSLEYYLKIAGFKIKLQKKEILQSLSDTKNINTKFIYIMNEVWIEETRDLESLFSKADNSLFLLESEEFIQHMINHQNCIKFSDMEQFYILLFEIIKKLLSNTDLTEIEAAFKKEYNSIHNLDSNIVLINANPQINKEIKNKEINLSFFKKRLIISSIVGILIVFCSILLGTIFWPEQNSVLQSKELIRSDLIIPTDASLLNRAHILSEINQKLSKQHGIQTIALVGIVGMGGIGKTTIARQFARLQTSSLVWEINAESKDSIINSFKVLAYTLAKTKSEKEELEFIKDIQKQEEREMQLLSFIKHYLKLHPNWLLIYDNVEDFPEIKNYFPHDPATWGKGRVIITTRDSNIKNNSYINSDFVIELNELTPEESLELFCKILYATPNYISSEEREKAKIFLKNIPPFPLDVSIAAYYLKDTQITYDKYLERLAIYKRNFNLRQETLLKEISDYTKTRYGIITLSFKKLIETNPKFIDLLLLICLLDSQHIPKNILTFYKDGCLIEEFLHQLRKYSIIIKESSIGKYTRLSTFSLHRSTQRLGLQFLLDMLSDKEKIRLTSETVSMIKEYYDKHTKKDYGSILLLTIHSEALLKNLQILSLSKDMIKEYEQALCYIIGYAYFTGPRNCIQAKKYLRHLTKDSQQRIEVGLQNSIILKIMRQL